MLIDGKFVDGPDADDQGDRHAGGESEDVYKGVAAVPAELSKGKEEIVFEHAIGFKIQQNRIQKSACFLLLNNQFIAIYLILRIVRFCTLCEKIDKSDTKKLKWDLI